MELGSHPDGAWAAHSDYPARSSEPVEALSALAREGVCRLETAGTGAGMCRFVCSDLRGEGLCGRGVVSMGRDHGAK